MAATATRVTLDHSAAGTRRLRRISDGGGFNEFDNLKADVSTRNAVSCPEGFAVTGLRCASDQCNEIELICNKVVYQFPSVALGQCIFDADTNSTGTFGFSATGSYSTGACCRAGTRSAEVPAARVCNA